jgi:hypothetical protein
LAAVSLINKVALFHKINTAVTLLCDCETGLDKAFSGKPLTLKDSSYDLLQAIRYELSHTTIQWSAKHIKGHQDDSIPYKELDRPGQLNVIVDQIAKDFPAQAKQQPRHYDVCSPSWELRINNIPIISDIENTLYDLVHQPIAKQYWVRKARIMDVTFDSVLVTILGPKGATRNGG